MPLASTLQKGFGTLLKYTLNPFTRRLARTRFGPFALIRHVGRRSGKAYETPVIVAPLGPDIVIELTYGPNVDWYKNVVAANGCTVLWHGRVYVVDRLEPLPAEAGQAAYPLPARLILSLLDRRDFVRLHVARSSPAPR